MRKGQRQIRLCRCGKQVSEKHSGGRFNGYYRTCGSDDCIHQGHTSNVGKAHYGENHPLWIKDRSKVKVNSRGLIRADERRFFSEVLNERNYTCEITGQVGGKLSVHHINSATKYPELAFKKDNVVVVCTYIHKAFHSIFGYRKFTFEDWNTFLNFWRYNCG